MDTIGGYIALALGVFFGNWLFVPLVTKSSFNKGFVIGLIAAALVMIFSLIKYLICRQFNYPML